MVCFSWEICGVWVKVGELLLVVESDEEGWGVDGSDKGCVCSANGDIGCVGAFGGDDGLMVLAVEVERIVLWLLVVRVRVFSR